MRYTFDAQVPLVLIVGRWSFRSRIEPSVGGGLASSLVRLHITWLIYIFKVE